MPSIKTAVSIDEELFEEADALAEQLDVSRSRLYAMALEQFLRRQRNLRLLEQINAAVEECDAAEDEEPMVAARGSHRRLVGGEW